MPFKEIQKIRELGHDSNQHDSLTKGAFADGLAAAPYPGDAAHHDIATVSEMNEYCRSLNYPGKVSPHGVFFLLDSKDTPGVAACSANSSMLFGKEPAQLLGTSFHDLFAQSERIKTALSAEDFYSVNPVVATVNGSKVNVILHRGANGVAADVEKLDGSDFESKIEKARDAASKLETCASVQALCEQVTSDIFDILGQDRVMIWQAKEDASLKFITEKKNETFKESLLGTTWFSTDLPPQSKLDYLRRQYSKLVVDATAEGAEIVTTGKLTAQSICLRDSTLRLPHQCLAEQMGAKGNKSLGTYPVVAQRRLWALVVCSHKDAYSAPFQTRMAVEYLVAAFSLKLSQMLDAELGAREEALIALSSSLTSQAGAESEVEAKIKVFVDAAPEISKAVPHVTSLAVLHQGKLTVAGPAAEEAVKKVVSKVQEVWKGKQGPHTMVMPSLSTLLPDLASAAATAAGAVAVPVGGEGGMLLLLRPEANATVTYAGDPSKGAGIINRETARVHARRDYTPTEVKLTGRSEEWGQSDVDASNNLASTLAAILGAQAGAGAEVVGMDVAATWEVSARLQKVEQRINSLVKEYKDA